MQSSGFIVSARPRRAIMQNSEKGHLGVPSQRLELASSDDFGATPPSFDTGRNRERPSTANHRAPRTSPMDPSLLALSRSEKLGSLKPGLQGYPRR